MSFGLGRNESSRILIPEIVSSGHDLSSCIDCTVGRKHSFNKSNLPSRWVRNKAPVEINKNKTLGFAFFLAFAAFAGMALLGFAAIVLISIAVRFILKVVKKAFPFLEPLITKLERLAGNALLYLNPVNLTLNLLKSWKITAGLIRELDYFTGGAITSIESMMSIPGRITRGDKIPKEEIIQDALFCIRVGVIALSGGTATTIVGVAANQMQQGALGQTEFGRVVLTIAQMAAIANATGQAWENVVQEEAIKTGQKEATEKAIQETALGRTEAGRLIITAGFTAAGSHAQGGDAAGAVSSLIKSSSESIAIREIAQELNVPYADEIAKGLVNNISRLDQISLSDIALDLDPSKVVDSIKKSIEKMPDVFSNLGEIRLPTLNLSEAGQDILNFGKKSIEVISDVPADIAKAVTTMSIPDKQDFKDFIKNLKEIKSDWVEFKENVCFYQNQLYQATGQMMPVKICKNSLARLPLKEGNRIRYIYIFDDGSMWGSPFQDATGALKVAALVGAGLILMNEIS